MLLDSNIIKKLEDFLILKGYTDIDRGGLIVLGGENNGTVDFKATNESTGISIIIEIKSNPIHLIDLSHYLTLKDNIESKIDKGKLKFFLLTCEKNISSEIKKIAKNRGIIIDNIETFVERKSL